jgi:hypothetical protein
VWGYDYFGGTRTVDVHVRRLRAKLGADNEDMIGTVRNVGYRFVPGRPGQGRGEPDADDGAGAAGADALTADAMAADGTVDGASAANSGQDGRGGAHPPQARHGEPGGRRKTRSAHADR